MSSRSVRSLLTTMVLCRIKVDLLKQFMVLTAEQTMRFRQLKTLVHQKLILAQPTLTVRSRLRSTRATTFPINRRFSISATGSALRRTPLGTIFVRKTSTATAQNGTAIRQKRKPPSSAATKSFIRPALLSMKAPMPPAISLLPRRSTTALLSTPPAISC